jgi:NitT/TauT family transport system substrate-binding protein
MSTSDDRPLPPDPTGGASPSVGSQPPGLSTTLDASGAAGMSPPTDLTWRHDGTETLLRLLGGLLLAGLVASAGPFVNALLEPFSRGRLDVRIDVSTEALLLAHLAYIGYLLNVFRQIHGLAIVVSDDDYREEVSCHLTMAARVRALIALVAVLALPAGLLAALQTDKSAPAGVLINRFTSVNGSLPPAAWVLLVHILTIVAYVIWDRSSQASSTRPPGVTERRWYAPYIHAATYYEFLHNWLWIGKCALIITGAMIPLFVGLTTNKGIQLVPHLLDGRSLLLAVLVLTYGYSSADYVLNRHFYFRPRRLGQLRDQMNSRASTHTQEIGMKRAPLVLLTTFLLAVIVVGFFLYRRALPATVAKPVVTLQLKWLYNSGFAGDLVARDRSFWQELDVKVLPGGVGIDPVKAVVGGAAQFGVATGDQLLLAAEQNAPVVAIALVYQENPLAWITADGSRIDGPSALRGRKVGLTYIDDEPLFRAMLKKVGLKAEEVTEVAVKFDVSPFLRGEIDAFPVFRNTQGIEISKQMAANGRGVARFVSPSDVGVVSYSNMYFTTADYIRQHPKIVQAFVDGALDGWSYVHKSPKDAAAIVKASDTGNTIEMIEACVAETNRLVMRGTTDSLGLMTADGWTKTQDVLLQGGILKKNLNLDSLFDNKFVKNWHARH